MAENINIGGRLHSIATGNVVTGANEILDDAKGKKQSQINTETDAALENRYTKAETYNKTELNNMITTPEIAYKDYDTYADMVAETVHPAGAIYRVANYDGTQAVTNKYAEYSWDGTQYKLMAVRDHGIDDEPVAGSENLVKSGGVAEELGELIVEGSGTSSTESSVYYVDKNLGYTIPSGTPLYIEVEGVGDNDDYPVSELRFRLNSITGPSYNVNGNRIVIPEVDATKLMVASTASITRFAGEVKVSVYYKGIKQNIADLQEDVEEINSSIGDIEADITTLQENVSDISDDVTNAQKDIANINSIIDGVELVEIARYEGLPKAYTSSNPNNTYITLNNPVVPGTNISLPVGGKIKVTVTGTDTAINKCSFRVKTPSGESSVTYHGSFDYEVVETINLIKIYTTSGNILDATKPVSVILEYEKSGIVDDIDSLTEDIDEVNTRIDNLYLNQDFNTEYIVTNFATDAENNEFSNSFTFTNQSNGKVNENMIISAEAKYINDADDAAPTIQIEYLSGTSTIYTSPAYTIGRKNEYEQKEWRMPPFTKGYSMVVTVTIPANVTLYIKEMSNRYSDVVNRPAVGFRMNAHIRQYNFNTLKGFTLSAKVGYPCAVVVPKRTSDGVWCCFHDDDNITGLTYPNGQMVCAKTTSEGSTIYTQYDSEGNVIGNSAIPVSSISWSDLSTYIYSSGSHVASLEDFFSVCAKTGMHPMFSWHPLPNAEQMEEVKNLVIKFGLLPYLNIKFSFSSGGSSSISAMNRAYSVFGSDIESYAGDVNTNNSITDIISDLGATDIDKTKVRLGIEFFNSKVTEEKVQALLAAGYFAAIAWMTEDPTGEMMDYWIRNGVTEFTEYRNYSNGLNW